MQRTAAVGDNVPDPMPCCSPCAQAYELLQGNLVRFSGDATTKDVPTAVLVHGILGSKRNLNSFARMLVEVSSSRHACAGNRIRRPKLRACPPAHALRALVLASGSQGFPTWQVVVVDLRCHGESAAAAGGHAAVGPHTVESSARDVLNMLRDLRMFPNMLVGHSFGGKVVMSMAHQFGASLPRPVQVRRGLLVQRSQWFLHMGVWGP